MMNKCNRKGPQELLDEALDFVYEVEAAGMQRFRMRPQEVGAIRALAYFAATRSGEECDSIPFEFGAIFPSHQSSVRWWKDETPQPLPFRTSSVKPGLLDLGESAEFERVPDSFACTVLALSVLDVAERYRKAS